MSKVYIRFEDENSRNGFVLGLLGINQLKPNISNKKAQKERKEWRESIKNFLTELTLPRKSNPYYKLHSQFIAGHIPKEADTSNPLSMAGVFAGGIRSLYTQSSYMRRPGYWLVIDFRSTDSGREKQKYIEANIPESSIGTNVPLPEVVRLQDTLKLIHEALTENNAYKYAFQALNYLNEIKEKKPSLFKGDSVYIWEDMARLFDTMDDLDNAAYCYRTEAELMKTSNDPYLNLGHLYDSRGYTEEAVAAYMKGLEINPGDEYIYYNLSSLLMANGKYDSALKSINAAILENPGRGLNHKFKGDIHFNRHEYHKAIVSYEYALKLFDKGWDSVAKECLNNLAAAYERIGNLETASEIRKRLEEKDKSDSLSCFICKKPISASEHYIDMQICKDPWDENPTHAILHSAESTSCEYEFIITYRDKLNYFLCNKCHRVIPSNSEHSVLSYKREILYFNYSEDYCLKCYKEIVLEYGNPFIDFQFSRIVGLFSPAVKENGYQIVEGFQNFFINAETTPVYCKKAIELIKSGYKVINSYEDMDCESNEGHITMWYKPR